MRSDPDNLLSLVEKVSQWLVCKRWKKVIYGAISVQKCKSFSGACHNILNQGLMAWGLKALGYICVCELQWPGRYSIELRMQ